MNLAALLEKLLEKETIEEDEPLLIRRSPWNVCRTWTATQKNPSVYGEWYEMTVNHGTGETLPSTQRVEIASISEE